MNRPFSLFDTTRRPGALFFSAVAQIPPHA